MQGQADHLGGGVYKKRLNDNMHRSIIVAKAGRHWIYAYLYAPDTLKNMKFTHSITRRPISILYQQSSSSLV